MLLPSAGGTHIVSKILATIPMRLAQGRKKSEVVDYSSILYLLYDSLRVYRLPISAISVIWFSLKHAKNYFVWKQKLKQVFVVHIEDMMVSFHND